MIEKNLKQILIKRKKGNNRKRKRKRKKRNNVKQGSTGI